MIEKLIIFFSFCNYAVMCLQASDFYIPDLPLWPKEVPFIRMHAGHLSVSPEHHGALFFWHFSSKYAADKSRTVIWLDGGPGCSSMFGAWMEIGPFRFRDNNTIVENNGSWHLFTNLLFVDQPVGTGFSYIDTDSFLHDLDQIVSHFLGFLERYIKIFPELLQNDIYLAGTSFAGQYIPYIAQAILEKRSILKLRGLLIGNGWIDPATTYKSYLPFAVANNLVEKDSKLYNSINDKVKLCEQALSKQVHVFEEECDRILSQIQEDSPENDYYAKNYKSRCINIYDLHLADTTTDCDGNGPTEAEYIMTYLHRQDVMSRIHVDGKKSGWTGCSDSVYTIFKAYHSEPSVKLLPDLLQKVPIVLFSGEYDLICNHWGTEAMIDAMTWNNGTGFDLGNGMLAPTVPWIVEGEPAGLVQTARNLTYILFYNAGHGVPYNYPRRTRVMLHQFIQLNLTSVNKQTTKKSIEETTRTTHRALRTRVMLHQSTQLNLTSFNKQTTKKSIEETTQTTDRAAKRVSLIAVGIIITIIPLMGLVWFFVHKQQQSGIPTPSSIIRILRSKIGSAERQQWPVYSLLNNSNENLHVPNNATLV